MRHDKSPLMLFEYKLHENRRRALLGAPPYLNEGDHFFGYYLGSRTLSQIEMFTDAMVSHLNLMNDNQVNVNRYKFGVVLNFIEKTEKEEKIFEIYQAYIDGKIQSCFIRL